MDEATALRIAEHLNPEFPLLHNAYQDVKIDCMVKLQAALQHVVSGTYKGKKFPFYSTEHMKIMDGSVKSWDVLENMLGIPMENDSESSDMRYQRIAISASFDCQEELGLTYSPEFLSLALNPLKLCSLDQMKAYTLPLDATIDEQVDMFELDSLCESEENTMDYSLEEYASDCSNMLEYYLDYLNGKDSDAGERKLLTIDDLFVRDYVSDILEHIRKRILPSISERDFYKIAPMVLDYLCAWNELDSFGMDEPAVAWTFSSQSLLDYILWREKNPMEEGALLAAMDSAVKVLRHPFRGAKTEEEKKKFFVYTGEVMGDDAYIFCVISNDLNDYSCNPCFQAARETFETLYPKFKSVYT